MPVQAVHSTSSPESQAARNLVATHAELVEARSDYARAVQRLRDAERGYKRAYVETITTFDQADDMGPIVAQPSTSYRRLGAAR